MIKPKIKDLVEKMISGFLEENGLELYSVEFIKEGKNRILRVYIDKRPSGKEETYVGTDDCELVSRYLSEKLDEADPIGQSYCLEVSSPGIERELSEQKHFDRYAGRPVELKLYKAEDGRKVRGGILVGLIGGKIVIRDENGRETEFPKEQVAKTVLADMF